jgi:transglutaminase-like putative cysteine protease
MNPGAASAPHVIDRFFEFSLLGMLAAGYSAVAGSGYLDWPTATLTALGLCLRALMVAGVVEFEFSGKLTAALSLAYIGFFPLDYFYVSGSFLRATVHMVFFLAVLKVLTAKTNRDYLYVEMIAVLELLAAAILSVSLSFFAFLTLFLWFAVATFASGEVRRSIQLRRSSVARGGLRAFPRRLTVLTLFLFAGVLTMTAGLFFVLPRTARAALERFIPERYHLPGFSNEVTLGQIGVIKQSGAPVMHVRSYQAAGLLDVKWRGAALSNFDGRRWYNSSGGGELLRVERGVLAFRRTRPPSRPGHNIIYQVQLNDIAADTLFVAGTPESISINLPFLERTRSGSFRPRFRAGGLSYGVYSFLEDESSPVLSPPDPLAPAVRDELLQLPRIDKRIFQLARQMTAGAESDEEEARALEMRLRHDYGYTLELLPSSVPDPLAHFLFVRKKGHCEYFASAMTVMLRTLGIPARVVTGFQSGVFNPLTGWQVVRASDAHSWVEAWINGRGWTTFDPTPPDPGAASAGVLARISLFFDAAEQFWRDWVLSYDLDRQIVLASRMEESGRILRFRWFEDTGASLKRAARASLHYAPAAGIGIAIAALALLYGPEAARRWRALQRVRKIQRGEGEASDATLLYQRMLGLLQKRGIQKPPWLTPVEFSRVIPASEVTMLVDDLTSAYNEFRFGGRRDVAPRMVRLLDQLEKL